MRKFIQVACFLTMTAAAVIAQIPQTISYQGVLTDAAGNPRPDDNYSFTFRLYQSATGGSPIWSESKTLGLSRGLFSTALGDVSPFGSAVAFDRQYYLAIQVGSDPELLPRIALTAVGYSYRSVKADTAATIPDNTITTAKLQDGAVTVSKINPSGATAGQVLSWSGTAWAPQSLPTGIAYTAAQGGGLELTGNAFSVANAGVTTQRIADGAISSAKIADGTIIDADISNSAAITGTKIAAGSITGTQLAENAVTSAKIVDGTIATADLADGAVTMSKVNQAGATAGQVLSWSGTAWAPQSLPTGTAYTAAQGGGLELTGNAFSVANAGVTTQRIADGAISSAKIADGTIIDADISNSAAITGTKIAAGSITGTQLAENAVTSAKIVDGTIATADLADGAVTMSKVNQAGATAGQVLKWTGSAWTPETDNELTLPYNESVPNTSGPAFQVTNTATSGVNFGVYGASNSVSGMGIYGTAPVYGVRGFASATTRVNYAVYGASNSTEGRGVYGLATTTSGANFGVFGQTNSATGRGVAGWASSASGENYGIYGESSSESGRGVYGTAPLYGVFGEGLVGVHGQTSSSSTTAVGVQGSAFYTGTSATYGIMGINHSATGRGVAGFAYSTSTFANFGIYGATSNPNGTFAGYFVGAVHVTGYLSKAAGSFKIDHPLDPTNKWLYHSFVESPDMMNIYNGTVALDGNGEAWVELPEWFEALNKEFRYQLTAIGAPGPNLYIASEIQTNRFKISGGTAGMKVSWQVTGIRKDAYAEKHRIPVEELKNSDERGFYMHPEVFGLSKEMAIPSNRLPETAESYQKRER